MQSYSQSLIGCGGDKGMGVGRILVESSSAASLPTHSRRPGVRAKVRCSPQVHTYHMSPI